jgi:hypothetical protein
MLKVRSCTLWSRQILRRSQSWCCSSSPVIRVPGATDWHIAAGEDLGEWFLPERWWAAPVLAGAAEPPPLPFLSIPYSLPAMRYQ